MDIQQAAEPSLSVLNNPSQTSVFGLEKDVVSQVTSLHETLWDELVLDLESQIAAGAPATPAWIQDRVLKFQYSATNPQVLQLINFAPTYPTIDEALRIVTRCSVKTDLNKLVKVKVAKSDPPVPLALLEYSSLSGYLNNILPAGVTFSLINLVSDKLYILAEVFYLGEYTSTIKDNVEAALNNYLATIPFDGLVRVAEIEDAIQAVSGVKDIRIDIIKARADATVLASATTIFSSVTSAPGVNARIWDTISGVIVGETTALNTFADTITYTVTS
jgi:hypothetical protein